MPREGLGPSEAHEGPRGVDAGELGFDHHHHTLPCKGRVYARMIYIYTPRGVGSHTARPSPRMCTASLLLTAAPQHALACATAADRSVRLSGCDVVWWWQHTGRRESAPTLLRCQQGACLGVLQQVRAYRDRRRRRLVCHVVLQLHHELELLAQLPVEVQLLRSDAGAQPAPAGGTTGRGGPSRGRPKSARRPWHVRRERTRAPAPCLPAAEAP